MKHVLTGYHVGGGAVVMVMVVVAMMVLVMLTVVVVVVATAVGGGGNVVCRPSPQCVAVLRQMAYKSAGQTLVPSFAWARTRNAFTAREL
jgi:hypothetical protein